MTLGKTHQRTSFAAGIVLAEVEGAPTPPNRHRYLTRCMMRTLVGYWTEMVWGGRQGGGRGLRTVIHVRLEAEEVERTG